MQKTYKKYFLAANSCEGFVSYFDSSYRTSDGWRAYIIKGGPGTGKSSLMKYITSVAGEKGYDTELCVCSSDPMSLDGVIIRDKKTVLLDGTSPHIVEPKYPGAVEEIINLGQFWNSDILSKREKEIIAVTKKNKSLHKRASRYLLAAGELLKDNFKIAANCCDENKIKKYAQVTCEKYIPKRDKTGNREIRFLSGITPEGIITYVKTVTAFCKNVVVTEDKFGAVSNVFMQTAENIALSNGYDVIVLKNPFLPSKITDHIIIPELSLCFAREYDYAHFETENRKIHSRRFTDLTKLHQNKSRLSFNRRLSAELLQNACFTLNAAKSVHDELEKYYVDAMNFSAAAQYGIDLAKKIFS